MTPTETLILAAYFFVLSILAVYGWHRYYLVYLYTKHRARTAPNPPPLEAYPVVTIQLPIFNEMYVVERLIDAVCRIRYPRERLEIQVLDDSTDETSQIVALSVRRHVASGIDIRHIRRTNRAGFKAGALAEGLRMARGELLAVFDADFVPLPSFLEQTVPYFADPGLGMVQARWGHINRDYSLLTRIQAILLDGHFVLEHGARNRAGCFFNFNGTAGVWRRSAIVDAGGWQTDTLTEDLDLSYRAQLQGWTFLFVPQVVAPAELPVEMNSFKSQQHRWAKGSIQTCRKLLPEILRSPLPLTVKVEAFFHLTANLNYPLMATLSILIVPSMVVRYNLGWTEMLLVDIPLFVAATLSFANFYIVSQRETYDDWWSRLKYIPFLMSVGIGLTVNNTRAVIEALLDRPSAFSRTPKYGVERRGDEWLGKRYQQSMLFQPIVEVGIGLYFTATVVYALTLGTYATVPFLVLFQVGYLYTGILSLVQQFADQDLPLPTLAADE